MRFDCPQCGKKDAIEAKMVGGEKTFVRDGMFIHDEWVKPEITSRHCPCTQITPASQTYIKTQVNKAWWEEVTK